MHLDCRAGVRWGVLRACLPLFFRDRQACYSRLQEFLEQQTPAAASSHAFGKKVGCPGPGASSQGALLTSIASTPMAKAPAR